MNIRFVLAAHTTRPTSFLVAKKSFCLYYIVYVFAQEIRVISTYQNLMYSYQFKSLLVFLKIPDNIF